ncbi:hypothetical protein O3Q51_02525 [Cryomorphaceae bacterium 1068]|nr:hypothetical protein [Cryomorphaceae bacterium 1068]
MKYMAAIIISVFVFSANAQDYIKKRVVSEEGIPLPYSSVRLQPISAGVIANEDGFFSISKTVLFEAEFVHISHLGYKSLSLKPTELEKLPIVALTKSINELGQVNILADSEKKWAEIIFEAFQKRRNEELEAQVIGQLTVRSYLEARPIEILEGEGIVLIDNTGVPEDLEFAFVQSNVDPTNEIQFFSIHTAGLLSKFSPFERSEVSVWPLHPGRLGKRSLHKDFQINLVNYNHETGISEFELISKSPEFLSAKVWISEDDLTILRYDIFGDNLSKLPIQSIIKDKSITDFSMNLTMDFGSESGRLNYLLWNYNFKYGDKDRINTQVKLPIVNGQIELPRFLRKDEYHDYAMAAILPQKVEEINEEMARSRSAKDIKALEALQTGSNLLDMGLIFWGRNLPLDVSTIPENTEYEKVSYDALADPSQIQSLKDKFRLAFNSVVYETSGGKYEHRTFLDQMNSAIPAISNLEVALLVNLIFDEHDYAAQRISNAATKENINALTESERDELQLRTDRLLINSRGATDLVYLLERNYSNYELHRIDRFYQLNQKILDSAIFARFNKHLNPGFTEDLALAFMLNGEYDNALKEIKSVKDPSAQSIYLQALIYYFSGDCKKFRIHLKKATEEGYKIPAEVTDFCL